MACYAHRGCVAQAAPAAATHPPQGYPQQHFAPQGYSQPAAVSRTPQTPPPVAYAQPAQSYEQGFPPQSTQVYVEPPPQEFHPSHPAFAAATSRCQRLDVTGSQNPTVSAIIRGTYSVWSENHGKPVYRKEEPMNNLDVLIYFWDEQDGPTFSGWWFGPKVGGDQVWAYSPEASATPPQTGWMVPYDGPVDTTFVVSPIGDHGAAWRQHEEEVERQRQARAYEEERRRYDAEQRRRAEEEAAREQWRRAEEEAARRRHEEEQARRREEERRRQEEEWRRHQEELRRQKEQWQREQTAAHGIRVIMGKLRTSSVDRETFESLKAELDEALRRSLGLCGAQGHAVQREAEECTEQLRRTAEATSRQREEQARVRQMREDQADTFLQSLGEVIASAEAAVENFQTRAKPVVDAGVLEWNDAVEGTKVALEIEEETTISCKACTRFMIDRRKEVEELRAWLNEDRRADFLKKQSKIHISLRMLQTVAKEVRLARDKAYRKEKARRDNEKIAALFDKYDKDGDGRLNRSEMAAYSKGEYEFDLSETVIDRILRNHGDGDEGVPRSKFNRVKSSVCIAREEQLSQLRKEEAERRRAELEANREELQKRCVKVSEATEACCSSVTSAMTAAGKVPETLQRVVPRAYMGEVAEDHALSELSAMADAINSAASSAEAELDSVKTEVSSLASSESTVDSELLVFLRNEVRRLQSRVDFFGQRLARSRELEANLLSLHRRKAHSEVEKLRGDVIKALLTHAEKTGKFGEDLFNSVDADQDGSVSLPDLVKFLDELGEAKPASLVEDQVARVFRCLCKDGTEVLSKEVIGRLTAVFYKVRKESVLTEEMAIKTGRTVRRLEEGEVFEAEGVTTKEEETEVLRIRGKALRDGALGFATVTGNQGTVFLEANDLVRATRGLDLFGALDSDTALRRLDPGEVLRVVEWDKKDDHNGAERMRVVAKSDGAIGWVTPRSATGESFLENL